MADALYRGEIEKGQAQSSLLDAFMEAVGLIARGGSPFVSDRTSKSNWTQGEWLGYNAMFRYQEDDSPLQEVSLEVPLDCISSQMVRIDQTSVAVPLFDPFSYFNASQNVNMSTTALTPNCTFHSLRSTGIYGGSRATASVVETVINTPPYYSAGFTDEVFLTKQGEKIDNVRLTPEMKSLARDREDWRHGRSLTGVVDGIHIGNSDVALGAVVIATGPEADPYFEYTPFDSAEIIWTRHNTYALVGEIVGKCPPRPSGLPATNTNCIAILMLYCPAFSEDYQIWPAADSYLVDSLCTIEELNMIWGRGYEVDAEMVATVAGLYGFIKPSKFEGRSQTRFYQNAPLAALFATGSLAVRPTVVEKVSPKIDGVYITFIFLPFFLLGVTVAVVVAARRARLPIPESPWELMVLGREEAEIPTRNDKTSQFPNVHDFDNCLALALINDQTGSSKELAIVSDPTRSGHFLTPHADNIKQEDTTPAAMQQTHEQSLGDEENIASSDLYSPSLYNTVAPEVSLPHCKRSPDPSGIFTRGNRASL